MSVGTATHVFQETMMAAPRSSPTRYYEIRLKGLLEARRGTFFEGMEITLDENGNTLLRGWLPDQAALHGLLKKVRDVGLTLLSLNSVRSEDEQ